MTDAITNCYEVLGLARGATTEDVRTAFRIRSHMFHPDKYENYPEPLRSQLVAEAAREFKRLTGAYEILRDPVQRAAHDRALARVPPAAVASRRASTSQSSRRDTAGETAPPRARRAAPPPETPESTEATRERDPQLLVRPERLDFGTVSPGAIGQLTLKIQNIGGRTLFGDLACDKSWVTLSERTFISNQVVIAVNLNAAGLHPGQAYVARITVKTLNGGDEVIPVTVRVAAVENPQLAGVPSLVDFGTTEAGKRKVRTITVTNSGTGTLQGSVATRHAWLGTSERNFRGNAVSLDLIADTTGLSVGDHSAIVAISTNGGPATVTVVINVVAPVTGEALAPRVATAPPPRTPADSRAPASGTMSRDSQRELLARISRLVPETDWEEDFLATVAQLVRAGRTLAPGELAKVFELEARTAAG